MMASCSNTFQKYIEKQIVPAQEIQTIVIDEDQEDIAQV